MNKSQIAKKYGRALINTFNIADIGGILDGLQLFSKMIDANKKLKPLFTSGIFTDDEKARALKTLLLHFKISQHAEKFLKLIIIQGHLSALKNIIKASVNAYNERLKKATAIVTSPVALEKIYLDRLKNTLKGLTRRDIDIENKIDQSLLGGFIVKVGSTIYDSSLRGQIRLLKEELTRNISMN